MKKTLIVSMVWCLACGAGLPAPKEAWANEMEALRTQVQELSVLVKDLKLTVDAQQKELQSLRSSGPVSGPASWLPVTGGRPSGVATGRWNPDIGVVADIVMQSDSPKSDEEGADRISAREVEIVFGSAVDPYIRLDVTLGIADFEEMSLEEAYATRFDLPLDFTARIGRFLPKIGKVLPVHRDSLDTVDLPLVLEKYFGHHGYNKTGVDLTRPIELPWDMTHEWTFGVLEGGNGEEGSLFGETRRHPTIYNRLKNYVDLNDVTGLELGVSHLVGSRDDDSSFEVNVIGLDGTLIHRYGDQRHIKLQSEAYHVNRRESFYPLEDETTSEIFNQDLDDARSLWGGYALLDWRFLPQWATGVRYDNVQLIETSEDFANPQQTERGFSTYLTFYQSEYARWRVQYSHLDLQSGDDDNRVFVQGTFAIGEHKHKLQ
ncbi:MAG: hypothetical protein MOGMAGMI_01552 [Candidatus Omnitrophica bacterium]|nr:hypothetical protein [Candidatus Omnitrophota bacterium]